MPRVKRKVNRKIPYKIIALIIGFMLITSGILVFFSTTLASDKIYKGVTVCDMDVSGMTREEANAAITQKVESSLGDKNIDIVYGDKRHAMDIADKVNIDYNAVVEGAYNVGRSGDIFERIAKIIGDKTSIPLAVQYDDKYIKSKIISFAQEIENENSVFKFSNDMKSVKIDLTGEGTIIDVDATFNQFVENASKMLFVDITTVSQKEFDNNSVELLYNRLTRDPVNATCEIINNKPVVKKHELGIRVDKSVISENIGNGKYVFDVEITTIMPTITVDKLESSMFKDLLSEFSTKYNASKEGRTKNMAVAVSKINGVVIAAGDNFSFNKVVGERTYAKGYTDANVYVGGRVEQGVGGGICQVVSTLYSAQLYADLQTVVRHNHQFTVSYLPLGQDATVAWDSLDYSFKNNTEYPIKILSVLNNGTLTIKILGTKADNERTVKIVTTTISTKEPKERVEISENLAAGKTIVTQNGQVGATVDTYKVYLKNGVEESRVFLHRSSYNAMERVVTKSSKVVAIVEPKSSNNSHNSSEWESTPIPTLPKSTQMPSATPEASPSPEPSKVPDSYTSDNGL